MNIAYTESADGVTPAMLAGFFEGWPVAPSPDQHLEILRAADRVVLARDQHRVVGFITALTDGILAAYIPLLEVLPDHRGTGIGSELIARMLRALDGLYMVDLLCDPPAQAFYERCGMTRATGMLIRDRGALGRPDDRGSV
jgi:GNAT superfamily N-acetyltransferase